MTDLDPTTFRELFSSGLARAAAGVRPSTAARPAGSAPSTGASRPAGRPTAVDEYSRGKLLIALACGLTQREAAIWAGTTQSNVSYLVNKGAFLDELREYTDFARLHPRMRMYQAARGSWRAAARLLGEFDRRGVPLTTDEIIDNMSIMLDQVIEATNRDEAQGRQGR